MRPLFVLMIAVLAISCGNPSRSKPNSIVGRQCQLNEQLVPCETMNETTDGLGIDLLDVQVEVPIKIANSQITFLDTKFDSATGRRISCKAEAKAGDIYQYNLDGDQLGVQTNSGQLTFTRSSGTGVNGNWVWSGNIDNGTHVIKQLIIIAENRAILKTHCEL
ncbi:MAG: hypothetical protein AB7I27_18515 [Bacteriovoracaceae bacterium]